VQQHGECEDPRHDEERRKQRACTHHHDAEQPVEHGARHPHALEGQPTGADGDRKEEQDTRKYGGIEGEHPAE
jgi:hypothetical protein